MEEADVITMSLFTVALPALLLLLQLSQVLRKILQVDPFYRLMKYKLRRIDDRPLILVRLEKVQDLKNIVG